MNSATTFDHISIITDSHYFDHDTGGGEHPESPVRLEVIMDSLLASPLLPYLDFVKPHPIDREWLLTGHDEAWLFRFEELVLSGRTYIDHVDNQVCYDSYDVACLSAAAGITGIDLIEDKKAKQVFCLVRPPGHHAERNIPFGFCFFNNCVIAAKYWENKFNKKRVVIFDFDAHHGNGIQSAFERSPTTYYVSLHEHPSFSYPGTGYADEKGLGEGAGSILNIPLLPGAGEKEVMKILRETVEPQLEIWQPDAMVIAAGFDSHVKDDMSGLGFTTELYGRIGRTVRGWSEKYCGGCLLSILEGGYELTVLGESVETYLRGLATRPE